MKLRLLITLMTMSVLLAACGDGGGLYGGGEETAAQQEAPAEQPEAPAPEPAPEEPAPAAGGPSVVVQESSLGPILTNGEGRTIYLFTSDPKDGTSACADECLANWPAVPGEAAPGEGIDPALFGTITRDDGATQATYNDWPLYYFAGDQAAGDVNGQGVGDVWYVVAPDGTAIQG